jgi:hypothetical protein
MVRHIGGAIIVGLLAASLAVSSAVAEVQILESNVSEFKPGARVRDLDAIQLPPGARVRVLILPSRETRIMRGPEIPGNGRDLPYGASREVPSIKRGNAPSTAPK